VIAAIGKSSILDKSSMKQEAFEFVVPNNQPMDGMEVDTFIMAHLFLQGTVRPQATRLSVLDSGIVFALLEFTASNSNC
jgi:hypothetical protein